jgi:putative membrane protein
MGLVKMIRTAVAGVLMGMANLIPGVSGGTMILAVGLYEEFIDSVADVTALRLSVRRIVFLGILTACAAASILMLSSLILYLLFWHSSLMFSLFIGLTLGGAPLLFRMIGRFQGTAALATVAGFALMAGIAFARQGAGMPRNTAMDFAAGLIGSVTMVLPGISGSYMLLILDQYDRVIGAISDLKSGSLESLKIIIPVGIGVVLGVVGLSNLLKVLLHRHEKATLGFLLGMLLGSVLGLWPFGRPPTEKTLEKRTDAELIQYADQVGIAGADALDGEPLIQHLIDGWDTRTAAQPDAKQILAALLALIAGIVGTVLLGRIGAKPKSADPPA